jgi:cytochrome c-type biogenesis protein CcmH/NrfF
VTGVIQSLLNFGNVLIQTAGAVVGMEPQQTVASIVIWSTPNPAKVVGVINDLMLQEEQEKLEGRAK